MIVNNETRDLARALLDRLDDVDDDHATDDSLDLARQLAETILAPPTEQEAGE